MNRAPTAISSVFLLLCSCSFINDAQYQARISTAIDWDGDGVKNETDCDPLNPDVAHPSVFYLDGDHDNFGDPDFSTELCEVIKGYVSDNTDCNDQADWIYPGAPELCDLPEEGRAPVDENCNGFANDDDPASQHDQKLWYADRDHDGFGDPRDSILSCFGDSVYSTLLEGDCDDENDRVNPDAAEVFDAYDNDCDGEGKRHLSDEPRILGGWNWATGDQDSFCLLSDVTGDGGQDIGAGRATGLEGEVHIAEWTPDSNLAQDSALNNISNRFYTGSNFSPASGGCWPANDFDENGYDDYWVTSTISDYYTTISLMPGGPEHRSMNVDFSTLSITNVLTQCPNLHCVQPAHALTGEWVGPDGQDIALGFPKANAVSYLNYSEGRVLLVDGTPFRDGSYSGSLSIYGGGVPYINGTTGERFGSQLAQGDWNSDGFEDLLVVSTPIGGTEDFVSSFLGPLDDLAGVANNLLDRRLDVIKEAGFQYGAILDTSGDTNGDGHTDLVVSTPVHKAVYVLLNDGTGDFSGALEAESTIQLTGGEGFGEGLVVHDFTQDGTAEIVVGEPYLTPENGAQYSGAVMIFEGTTSGTYNLDDAMGVIRSQTEKLMLGAGLAAGDLDGNGFADLVLGAPGWEYTTNNGNSTNESGSLWAIYDPGW